MSMNETVNHLRYDQVAKYSLLSYLSSPKFVASAMQNWLRERDANYHNFIQLCEKASQDVNIVEFSYPLIDDRYAIRNFERWTFLNDYYNQWCSDHNIPSDAYIFDPNITDGTVSGVSVRGFIKYYAASNRKVHDFEILDTIDNTMMLITEDSPYFDVDTPLGANSTGTSIASIMSILADSYNNALALEAAVYTFTLDNINTISDRLLAYRERLRSYGNNMNDITEAIQTHYANMLITARSLGELSRAFLSDEFISSSTSNPSVIIPRSAVYAYTGSSPLSLFSLPTISFNPMVVVEKAYKKIESWRSLNVLLAAYLAVGMSWTISKAKKVYTEPDVCTIDEEGSDSTVAGTALIFKVRDVDLLMQREESDPNPSFESLLDMASCAPLYDTSADDDHSHYDSLVTFGDIMSKAIEKPVDEPIVPLDCDFSIDTIFASIEISNLSKFRAKVYPSTESSVTRALFFMNYDAIVRFKVCDPSLISAFFVAMHDYFKVDAVSVSKITTDPLSSVMLTDLVSRLGVPDKASRGYLSDVVLAGGFASALSLKLLSPKAYYVDDDGVINGQVRVMSISDPSPMLFDPTNDNFFLGEAHATNVDVFSAFTGYHGSMDNRTYQPDEISYPGTQSFVGTPSQQNVPRISGLTRAIPGNFVIQYLFQRFAMGYAFPLSTEFMPFLPGCLTASTPKFTIKTDDDLYKNMIDFTKKTVTVVAAAYILIKYAKPVLAFFRKNALKLAALERYYGDRILAGQPISNKDLATLRALRRTDRIYRMLFGVAVSTTPSTMAISDLLDNNSQSINDVINGINDNGEALNRIKAMISGSSQSINDVINGINDNGEALNRIKAMISGS